MHKRNAARARISEDERMKGLSVLPLEVKDAYFDVTRYHHRLLERLAQR